MWLRNQICPMLQIAKWSPWFKYLIPCIWCCTTWISYSLHYFVNRWQVKWQTRTCRNDRAIVIIMVSSHKMAPPISRMIARRNNNNKNSLRKNTSVPLRPHHPCHASHYCLRKSLTPTSMTKLQLWIRRRTGPFHSPSRPTLLRLANGGAGDIIPSNTDTTTNNNKDNDGNTKDVVLQGRTLLCRLALLYRPLMCLYD